MGKKGFYILLSIIGSIASVVSVIFIFLPKNSHIENSNSTITENNSTIIKNVENVKPPIDASIKEKSNNNIQSSEEVYINTSFINSVENIDVSVTIIDKSGILLNSLSNSIAEIYSNSGKIGNTGLIKSGFINKPEFQELFEGNSTIINNLKLFDHTDFLVLGKLEQNISSGTLVNGSLVCNSTLIICIISTKTKSIYKSFSIDDIAGNGVNESQAKQYSLQNLVSRFSRYYSSI